LVFSVAEKSKEIFFLALNRVKLRSVCRGERAIEKPFVFERAGVLFVAQIDPVREALPPSIPLKTQKNMSKAKVIFFQKMTFCSCSKKSALSYRKTH